VVDSGNLGSLETGWPYGIYNRALISGPVVFREGAGSETYEGIGKKTWHLAGRPVLADSAGAFGSPISDSTRTMVTEAARDILAVIYAPASAVRAKIESALGELSRRLRESAKGRDARTSIIAP
jgi:DNA/RNA-binding domain of Phe-tRNA-synthetase-like protein